MADSVRVAQGLRTKFLTVVSAEGNCIPAWSAEVAGNLALSPCVNERRHFVVELLGEVPYFQVMLEMIEHRLDEVEKRVAELGALVGAGPGKKDWMATIGSLPDDHLSREADRLGREYRDSVNDSGNRAGA